MRNKKGNEVVKMLQHNDPEIAQIIEREMDREATRLQMIASENYTSTAVLEAQGSVFTNKYAEGYPHARYYQGCGPSDELEQLARERLQILFGVEHANVQPHSGSSANMAAFLALLKPGDRILGMDLADGGHLTHGAKFNFSGKLFAAHTYRVDPKTHWLDYTALRDTAKTIRPALIIAGASSYPRQLDFAAFRSIADEVGARLLVDMAHIAGLVAGGAHPSPVPFADMITSTTHKTLRGPRGGFILCSREHAKAVDAAVFPGIQGGPLMHVIAAKAVSFHEAAQESFRAYAQQVVLNAKALAEALLGQGLSLITGGTDNHLVLLDLRAEGKTGAEVAEQLELAGIVANKNGIPYDPLGSRVTSGVRLGVAAITSLGMRQAEMSLIAEWIATVIRHLGDEQAIKKMNQEVRGLCNRFPLHL
jgi:glycine hydroxymethyltransferase